MRVRDAILIVVRQVFLYKEAFTLFIIITKKQRNYTNYKELEMFLSLTETDGQRKAPATRVKTHRLLQVCKQLSCSKSVHKLSTS